MKKTLYSLLLVLTISILIVPIGVNGEPLQATSIEYTIANDVDAIVNYATLDNTSVVVGTLPNIVAESIVISNVSITETFENLRAYVESRFTAQLTSGGEEILKIILPNSSVVINSTNRTTVNCNERSTVAVGVL